MIASLSDDSKQSARQHIDRFVQRFDDSYRKLAYYAALPLVLTPDLLNYLRNQFLRGEVLWVAEIDLLLSELCSPTGYEQYVMETAVRAVLLEEMEQVLGRTRMESVAQLLIDYVRKLARTTPQISQRSLQTQQWAAMVYLDDQRQTAVEQIARSLQNALPEQVAVGQAGLSTANQAELAQLARITQELAPQLESHTTLLEYARVVSQLLVDRTSMSPESLDRSYVVEGVELRVPGMGEAEVARSRVEEQMPVEEFVLEQASVEIAQPNVEEPAENRNFSKVLILASNPRKDLRLDREVRDLREVIERSRHQEQFEVVHDLAVRVGDLQKLLLLHQPQIVHFCGHGGGAAGLVFEGNDGSEQWIRAEALSDLFRIFPSVNCVVLNPCYDESQVNAIANQINYVIGMRQPIGDNVAIAFATGFYMALGFGRSIEQSYEFGCNQIQLAISGSSKALLDISEIADTTGTTVIPEHLKPIFKKRRSLNNVSGSESPSSETQVEVNQVLEEAANRKQYRERVREFLSDRKISNLERIRLEQLRKNLGLSAEEANQISTEEYEPIQQSQDEYREILNHLIEAGDYPFSSEINNELQRLLEELKLTDAEVETISQPIFEAAKSTILNNASQAPNTIGSSNTEAYIPPQLDRSSDLTSVRSKRSSPTTILILPANPVSNSQLRLNQEVRDIEEGLRLSKQQNRFRLESRWAVRPRDVQRAMLDLNPQIVHFSGRGQEHEFVGEAGRSLSRQNVALEDDSIWEASQNATSGLVFEDEEGNPKLASGEALAGLFGLFVDHVECVVLDGCYSTTQAEAIAQQIPYVIGMTKAIGDWAAIEFVVSFYDALGAGRSIEDAYQLGCVAIQMAGIAEHLTPVLTRRKSR